jgi:hypothetical protein
LRSAANSRRTTDSSTVAQAAAPSDDITLARIRAFEIEALGIVVYFDNCDLEIDLATPTILHLARHPNVSYSYRASALIFESTMAPVRTAKRQSSVSATRTPPRGAARITQGQKQALIDNLQLEGKRRCAQYEIGRTDQQVTERARKLRAQYALQAQGLRSRVELRVNRIPTSLRKVTMAELLDKYAKSTKTGGATAAVKGTTKAPARPPLEASKSTSRSMLSPGPSRGTKRNRYFTLLFQLHCCSFS